MSDSGATYRSRQRYRKEWEEEFPAWLRPVPGDRYKAFCRFCCTELRCHHRDLVAHSRTKKHKNWTEAKLQIETAESICVMASNLQGAADDAVTLSSASETTEVVSKLSEDAVLLEPYKYILQVPGKHIRTKLSAAFNCWLNVPEEKLSIIKEVAQMLHNASLLLDDIEDSSKLRRGIPVAHNIFGVPTTINCANYVIFLALEKCLKLDHPDVTTVFTEQLLELHRGQGMDIYWRDTSTCPTLEEYKAMVTRKTGGLFGLVIRLMQLFSSCKTSFKPLLDALGLYFQIRDDYANLYSKEYEKNKSYCEDLTEGKFSFPIIYGIMQEKESNQIISILRQHTEDYDVKKYCVEYLEKYGAFTYTAKVLVELEEEITNLITSHGGNPHLMHLMSELKGIYTQPINLSS